MRSISFSIILIPLIVISLDILLYAILWKKTTRKKPLKKFALAMFIFAFLLNALWEISQILLYKDGIYSFSHILFCLLASVADAIMVMLIYFSFAIIYKNALWIQNIKLKQIFFLIIVGAIGAVLAETRHLSIGTWSYSESMPIIPYLNVGLSPILQFMILPLLIYIISFKIISRFAIPKNI
jgi:hypothetical protein